jgi:choline dehydrogenase
MMSLKVGSGSAGAVVAARLAEDKGHSVLLLEAGGNPSFLFDTPSIAPLLQNTDFDWGFKTVPQKNSSLGLEDQVNFNFLSVTFVRAEVTLV